MLLAFTALLLLAVAEPPAGRAGDLLSSHCIDCHGAGTTKGKLDLRPVVAAIEAGSLAPDQRAALRRARVRVEAGEMPPPDHDADDRAPLSTADRATLATALRAATRTTGPLPAPPGPGPRRLNRVEYANAVRDLLDVDVADLDALPPDDVGAGFDNVAAVLSLPPRALERHLELAEAIAARACPDTLPPGAMLVDLPGDRLRVSAGKAGQGKALVWSRGTAEAAVQVPTETTCAIAFSASGMQAGKEPVKAAVLVDGKAVAHFDIPEPVDQPGERTCAATVPAGSHTVAIEFLNDFFEKAGPDGKPQDRNLVVHALKVRAPMEPPRPRPWQQRMERAMPAGAGGRDTSTRETAELRWLAGQFLGRPAADADLATLSAAIAPVAAASREARLRAAITALLVHPEFLFRVEADPAPPQRERELAGHEIAARLAAFLWCSVPDDALRAAADSGKLGRPDSLRTEVERMLADARASRLADRFAPQWLAIDAIEDRSPDPSLHPGVDAALLGSMRAETVLFFDAVLREGRPAAELLGADFTFVDERLARHYGLPAPTGGGMRRAAVDPVRGGGVLAHAAVLLATSNPTRTSPVKRGKWVLESLLDSAPPPPPPGTPQLPDTAATASSARSMRELLAAHRADPSCAACHRRMDALGFAFESWDAVGRHRDRVAGQPVDDAGQLPDGRTIAGLDALRREIAANPDFLRSLVRHLMTFATGRECGPIDDDHIDRLLEELGPAPTLRDMVIAVATSPAMRTRGAR